MKFYKVKLVNKQAKASWFPAQEIYDQLNICPYVYYDSAGSQDVQVGKSII
jgi:hypothetical protein